MLWSRWTNKVIQLNVYMVYVLITIAMAAVSLSRNLQGGYANCLSLPGAASLFAIQCTCCVRRRRCNPASQEPDTKPNPDSSSQPRCRLPRWDSPSTCGCTFCTQPPLQVRWPATPQKSAGPAPCLTVRTRRHAGLGGRRRANRTRGRAPADSPQPPCAAPDRWLRCRPAIRLQVGAARPGPGHRHRTFWAHDAGGARAKTHWSPVW